MQAMQIFWHDLAMNAKILVNDSFIMISQNLIWRFGILWEFMHHNAYNIFTFPGNKTVYGCMWS